MKNKKEGEKKDVVVEKGKEVSVNSTGVYSLSEMNSMAESVAKSGLFPSAKTKEAAFTLMMLCQAEGLHPMQAVRRFHVISGYATMKSDAVLAEFQNRGGRVEWVTWTSEECTGVFHAPGLIRPVSITWTIADAMRAKLAGKDNWKNYPRQMLKARVVTDGVRMAMPEVLVGLHSEEEASDIPEAAVSKTFKMPSRSSEKKKTAPEYNLGEVVDAEVPKKKDGAGDVAGVVVGLEDVTYKKVDGGFEFTVLDSEGVEYKTRDKGLARLCKERKEAGHTVTLEWKTVPLADGFINELTSVS